MTTLDPLTQIRMALSDPGGALLAAAVAGEAEAVTYEALYGHYGGNAEATVRAAAGILAGYFARQVSSVSSGGEGVSWERSRYEFYAAIAAGRGGGLAAGASDHASGFSPVRVVW